MSADDFELEAPTPGMPSEHVIGELVRCYQVARDHAGALGDAITAQAEKHNINVKALRRYIAAKAGDKLAELDREADDLAALLAVREDE